METLTILPPARYACQTGLKKNHVQLELTDPMPLWVLQTPEQGMFMADFHHIGDQRNRLDPAAPTREDTLDTAR